MWTIGNRELRLGSIISWKCKWLKEFYDVQLIIINKDNNILSNCSSTLTVPDGLTLVKGDLTQNMGDLAPNQVKTADWYLRGDKEGDYDLTAVLTGSNNGKQFDYDFKSKETLHVYAESALKMYIKLPRYSYFNRYYPITIGLTNTSDKPIYGLENEISNVMQVSNAALKRTVKGVTNDVASKRADLINENNASYLSIDELAPGETAEIELQVKDLWKSVYEQYIDAERFDANQRRLMELLSQRPYMTNIYRFYTIYESLFSELPTEHILKNINVSFQGSAPIAYEVIIEEPEDGKNGTVKRIVTNAANNRLRDIFNGPENPENAYEAFRNDYMQQCI